MSAFDARLHAGAGPVGVLADAPPDERLLVAALRLWLAAPEGRNRAHALIALARGPQTAARASAALADFLAAVADGATRRLWRHPPGCACLGRDEAALAALVVMAGDGALEAAHGAARALVRPDACFATVQAAAQLGRALRPAAPRPAPPRPVDPAPP